ncbi:MAG: NAD-dependent epimerase/dehydratase family protein, partial [Actinomycetes bacterium]
MRILITGLTGFIGGQLAPKLLDRGHELVALVRDPSRVPDHLTGQIELV